MNSITYSFQLGIVQEATISSDFLTADRTWGLTYSWTSGPPSNPTYHYSSDAMPLTVGATYTFSITAEGGVTYFIASQGLTQVWSPDAPTGGNDLVVSSVYSGYYNYTDYEETANSHLWRSSRF